ncbi:glycoside hydrolase family 26 protein [Actinomadura sp. SCN-SB]|uniref:glycoside hydrolase family 26 protein n=1 Tax=Actinomadura sp. SCN-SB TaxID=3373092 RepID=UPI0037526541
METGAGHCSRRPFGYARRRSGIGFFSRPMTALAVAVALALAVVVGAWADGSRSYGEWHRYGEWHQGAALGIFVGSGADALVRVDSFGRWLGRPATVGHTYLPGDTWAGVEGPVGLIRPWARWRRADPARLLVINVPMAAPNEAGMPDAMVASFLRGGASGSYDQHYRVLAERLVAEGAEDAILVLGWEMNGAFYSGRCGPDPQAWKAYWRRIVAAMRGVQGARFRFDFTFTRGRDAVPWADCYPGDDVVDIIGSDSYDQPKGATFEQHVREPFGLQAHAEFATRHGKPMSFPEWGLFRNSDNPDYIRGMHQWISSHNVLYQTITDYCPHGIWQCTANPRSAVAYRELFGKNSAGSAGS